MRSIRTLATIMLLCAVPSVAAAQAGPKCSVATDCKGMLPHNCQLCKDGKEACAHWACEHDQCRVEVCPPAPSANSCKTASDCKRVLPHNCQLCKDGKEACAHWACEENRCQIETCGPGR